MQESAEDLRQQRDELLAACKELTRSFIDGGHHQFGNPYCVPSVEAALIAIGKATGQPTDGMRWMDVKL